MVLQILHAYTPKRMQGIHIHIFLQTKMIVNFRANISAYTDRNKIF